MPNEQGPTTTLARRALIQRSLGVAAALATGQAFGQSPAPTKGRRTGSVSTPYGQLRYEALGDGPPVVAISGGPGTSLRSLGNALDSLSDTHTVVYFDNIGRGLSDDLPPQHAHSPYRDAEDVEHLRKALGFNKIALFGHSYGGYPALAYAKAFGANLSHLMLSSTGYRASSWQSNIDSVAGFVRSQYPEVARQLEALTRKGVKSSSAEYQAVFDAVDLEALYWYDRSKQSARTPPSNPKERFRAGVYHAIVGDDPEVRVGGTLREFDATEVLRQLKCPLLITSGRHDRIALPSVAEEMKNLAAKAPARWAVLERSGHFPWIEEPDSFKQVLKGFLQS